MGTDFEKKLKERAVSTENMLNSEFRKLEASVDRELNLNGQKIRDAISAHTAAVKEQLETLNSAVNGSSAPQRTNWPGGRKSCSGSWSKGGYCTRR
nr:MbeB family mobilization protein [Escherichia coli]